MLIDVTWHDDLHDGNPTRKTRTVEVRDRADGSYFRIGVLNQAMRQYGYSEEDIHKEYYVGPVEFNLQKDTP